MSIKKLKKSAVKRLTTKDRLDELELHLSMLDRNLGSITQLLRGRKISIATSERAVAEIQDMLESCRSTFGAVHAEAKDFINYLEHARVEIDEFKNSTMKELKALTERTKRYSLDDNKEILLEND